MMITLLAIWEMLPGDHADVTYGITATNVARVLLNKKKDNLNVNTDIIDNSEPVK